MSALLPILILLAALVVALRHTSPSRPDAGLSGTDNRGVEDRDLARVRADLAVLTRDEPAGFAHAPRLPLSRHHRGSAGQVGC
ncbi:hypothetical protein F0L68_40040 [Solihabitans fulvus]|uniref:Uncharacterized protein n=1 Tax=Solihabitans fulvus TaxID=1892852 RepID=A0A5B2WB18_9PSEU|nr:hypothetical protein [Solihabitans fulvus]KAA2247676.1 hypothetical protein F0L68_40040 [Solihabitans fulvus]